MIRIIKSWCKIKKISKASVGLNRFEEIKLKHNSCIHFWSNNFGRRTFSVKMLVNPVDILCGECFEDHKISDCRFQKLKIETKWTIWRFCGFYCIYCSKCFQIQYSHMKSMVIKWLLSISNHQNEVLLQINLNFEPIWLE